MNFMSLVVLVTQKKYIGFPKTMGNSRKLGKPRSKKSPKKVVTPCPLALNSGKSQPYLVNTSD
jgi:hypothetical protein